MHAEIIQPAAPPVRVELTHQEAKALRAALAELVCPDPSGPLGALLVALAEVLP